MWAKKSRTSKLKHFFNLRYVNNQFFQKYDVKNVEFLKIHSRNSHMKIKKKNCVVDNNDFNQNSPLTKQSKQ